MIFSMVLSTLVIPEIRNEITKKFAEIGYSEIALTPNNFFNNGYNIYENELVAVQHDPSLTFMDFNQKIKKVTLFFTQDIAKEISIQLYYTSEKGESFSEDKLVYAMIPIGCDSYEMYVEKYVTDLRLDFGDNAGESIPLDKIVFNEKITFQNIIKESKSEILSNIWMDRFFLFFFPVLFLGLHLIVDIRGMYDFIWKYRWLIGAVLLLYMVINKYHGDSMSLYDNYIQPGSGSEYIEPIIGQPRPIRTDEWIVQTPATIAASYGDHPYSKYNNIMRADKTLNLVGGLRLGYAGLYNPFRFIASCLPIDYGFSFLWYSQIIITFLVSLEFCYLLSKGKRLLAAAGAFTITFSSFYLWWNFPLIIVFSQGAIVCIYYFLKNNSKIIRALLSMGLGLAGAGFITILYPAWQVPLGYIFLGILIWSLLTNLEEVKKLDKLDWLMIVLGLLFMFSIVFAYLLEGREYIESISKTVYPGNRKNYGGYYLDKIFYYFISPLLPYKEIGNHSEMSTFISFFPIPLIAGVQILFNKEQKIQNKTKWLLGILLLGTIFLVIYSTIGFNKIISDITLMSYTIPERVIDIIGLTQVYVMIIVLAENQDIGMKNNTFLAGVIGGLCGLMALFICNKSYPQCVSATYAILMISFTVIIGISMMAGVSKQMMNFSLILIILVSIINGIYVRPVNKGLDAITSKPLTNKIDEIMESEKDSRWVVYGDSSIMSGYLVACGAPTINSVNYYPNLSLWEKVDPEGNYSDIYNRYARIAFIFSEGETFFDLVYPDAIRVNLAYEDLEVLDVNYIFSLEVLDLSNQSNFNAELIYDEKGSYIYKILYLQ